MREFLRLGVMLLLGISLAMCGFLWKTRQDGAAPVGNPNPPSNGLQTRVNEAERRLDDVERRLDQARRDAEENKSALNGAQARLAQVERNLDDARQSVTALNATFAKKSTEWDARAAAPATPAPATAAAPGATPPFSADKAMRFLAIIKGDRFVGSGFIAKFKTGTSLITNAHVLSGNATFTAQLADGGMVVMEGFRCARGRDIVSVESSKLADGLEIMDDVASGAAIGDDVMILGNSLGGGVVTQIPGKITGIGPDLVEVDAKFVSGNSGSPVIHVKTGKVIGIATYSTIHKVTGDFGKDSSYDNVERRFAYRLDNVPAWQDTAWPVFRQEGQVMSAIKERSDALLDLAKELGKSGSVHYAAFMADDNPLHGVVAEFHDNMNRYSKQDLHYEESKKEFMDEVVDLCTRDVEHLRPEQFSSYHAESLRDQIEGREEMAKFFHDFRRW